MTRTELDDAMERVAQDTNSECFRPPADQKLTCPCCGGNGEHYTHPVAPYMQDVDRQCGFCKGWGYLIIQQVPIRAEWTEKEG